MTDGDGKRINLSKEKKRKLLETKTFGQSVRFIVDSCCFTGSGVSDRPRGLLSSKSWESLTQQKKYNMFVMITKSWFSKTE
jgi:hypothetical protein